MKKYLSSLLVLFVFICLTRAFAIRPKYEGKFKTGIITIVMTVDWEGRSLDDNNLNAMKAFRQKYPGIPILHFLNAAYYTKPDAKEEIITQRINSVLRPHDEHGLHIHSWKTLVEASGVTFRKTPDLGGWSLRDCNYDCGHVISLEAYDALEVKKIIHKSVEILTKHNFKRPTSFRAGAWQTGPNVTEALASEGFLIDSSATVTDFIDPSWGIGSELHRWIKKLWPNMKVTQNPYILYNKNGRVLWEVPNNGSLADYTKSDVIMKVLKKNVDDYVKNPVPRKYVNIGFHQETAEKNLPRIIEAIEKIIVYGKKKGVPIQFSHFPLNFN